MGACLRCDMERLEDRISELLGLCAAHVQKMKQPIKPTHGGKRLGAGRKPGNPRQSLSIRISEPAMARLDQLRESTGISAGKLVEAMILNETNNHTP
jgi:hypothetical protein